MNAIYSSTVRRLRHGPRHLGRFNAWLVLGLALLLARRIRNNVCDAEAKPLEARDWTHLQGMPQPQAVLSRIGHADPLTAIVRQCQALTQLHGLFNDPLFVPGSLGTPPAAGQQLRGEYERMIDQDLYKRFQQARKTRGDARSAWRQACKGEALAVASAASSG